MRPTLFVKGFAVIALTIVIVQAQGLIAPDAAPPPTAPKATTLRVAAIGGINDHDFWRQLADRFERATSVRVETVATGKDRVADLFRRGGIDLIALQSSDQAVALSAEGCVTEVRPWMYSDLALVGPESDPASVKGSPDIVDAIRRIAKSDSPFIVHDSSGAHDVLLGVTQANAIELDPGRTAHLLDDHQRRVLAIAAERNAYTLIGRVPFLSGKLQRDGLTLMLTNDKRLRRPFVLAIANPKKFPRGNVADAERLAAFLLSAETQTWIGQYGRGKLDDQPLFFPLGD